MVALIIKVTVLMVHMIKKIRITTTITEKNDTNNNGDNTATQVTIKTQTKSNEETLI